jgi:SAM-dependent methyltransferase
MSSALKVTALAVILAGTGVLVYRDATRKPEVIVGECKPSIPAQVAKAFTQIYDDKVWGVGSGGEGTSGGGSTLAATVVYRAYLQQFLKDHGVRSVVDAGCGDWEFSSAMDWSGIDYTGFDVVPSVIAEDQRKYGAPNIKFQTADIVRTDLPAADLLVCKDVLQHLPQQDVLAFLAQLPKYKYVLLTDTVDKATLTAENHEIKPGDFRLLDVTKPPFSMPGLKVLTYFDGGHMHQVVLLMTAARGTAPHVPDP